ncbi:MAG TPA: hypothetical protein VKE51_23865, partial [Vicinamibacterales bacterium]|nr:hypothetical protein [Vicinamibacterales bacterium]
MLPLLVAASLAVSAPPVVAIRSSCEARLLIRMARPRLPSSKAFPMHARQSAISGGASRYRLCPGRPSA